MLSPVHAPDSWIEFVPDWDALDERFRNVVVPRFFAVLVYRLDWLKQHLPGNHPLWHSKAATSGKLLQFIPHVQIENRPLASLTGVSLEMKNALRLAYLAQGTTLPIVAEGVCSVTSRVSTSQRLAPSERDDLGLRLLTPLPGNERVYSVLVYFRSDLAFTMLPKFKNSRLLGVKVWCEQQTLSSASDARPSACIACIAILA
jgi:hypothetical protein